MQLSLPSKSNTVGSLAGLVAGLVVNKLVAVGTITAIAAFTGFPPTSITMIITAGVASLVNYGVTHYGTLKNWDDLVKELPEIEKTYPGDFKGPKSSNNLQNPQ